MDWFVTTAWANDPFGVLPFVQSIGGLIRALAVVLVGIVATWKGIQVISSRGLRDIVEEIIILAVGIAFILGAPAIATAAVGGVLGASLSAVLGIVSWSHAVGEVVGVGLAVPIYLLPGFTLWQWGQRRRRG
jgi:hypothetical protein